MNKEKWQQELCQLKLSEIQKQKMKKSIIEKKTKRKPTVSRGYWLVMPAFIVLVLFSTYLIIGDKMNDSLVHQATLPPDIETDHTAYFNELSGYLGTIFIVTLLNSYVGFLVIMKTERWQQPWLVKWREKLTGREKGVFIFIPIITIIFLYFLIYLNCTIILLKWVLAALLLVLHACIFLWLTREAKGHLVCPHCHHKYSKKESRKVWRTMLKPLSCPICQEEVYYSKKSRKLSGITNIINLILLFVIFNLGLPFGYVFGCIAIYFIFIGRKIFPSLLELEEKEEFMW